MTAVLDTVGLAHLVAVVARCRPDWDQPGIRAALEAALGRHPYPDVALVAVASARDPKARTPAVIGVRCDQGWTGNNTTDPPTRTPPHRDDLICGCGFLVTPGEREDHVCARRADPDHARTMRDQAKAAAAAATRHAAKETA